MCSVKEVVHDRKSEHKQYTAVAVQRFHGDDEEALVDGVYLNEESLTQITRLFKVEEQIIYACYHMVGVVGRIHTLVILYY